MFAPLSGAPLGNRTQSIDALSVVTNMTYDAMDRLATVAYPASPSENVTYTYDQTGTHGKGIGRLTSVTDASGSRSLAYDERGNVTSDARTVGATTRTTGYSYDNASRVSSITYPSGRVINYTRDSMGKITAVKLAAANLVTLVGYQPPKQYQERRDGTRHL